MMNLLFSFCMNNYTPWNYQKRLITETWHMTWIFQTIIDAENNIYSIGDLYLMINIFDILCLMKIMGKTAIKIIFKWLSFSYDMDFCKFRDKHCQRVSLKIYRSIKRCVMIFRDFFNSSIFFLSSGSKYVTNSFRVHENIT